MYLSEVRVQCSLEPISGEFIQTVSGQWGAQCTPAQSE